MLTLEEAKGLKIGDVVQTTSPLFKGLSPEPVKMRVHKIEGNTIRFVSTWMGVTLGQWVATLTDKVEWKF